MGRGGRIWTQEWAGNPKSGNPIKEISRIRQIERKAASGLDNQCNKMTSSPPPFLPIWALRYIRLLRGDCKYRYNWIPDISDLLHQNQKSSHRFVHPGVRLEWLRARQSICFKTILMLFWSHIDITVDQMFIIFPKPADIHASPRLSSRFWRIWIFEIEILS